MPRTARLDVAGVAQHVVQRGNDRQPCFFRDVDYLRYLTDLREASMRFACQIHAYVLMTNHVHLLATPSSAGQVGRMMQALGRRYVRYVNDSHARTGTLWEGRYKSCLVDRERYLMTCYRYIELNPVRAGLVAHPAAYRWSSYHANALGAFDPVVTPHEVYLRLADQRGQRLDVYRAMIAQAFEEEDIVALRSHVQHQKALGSERFRDAIEVQLGRRARIGIPGRPRKPSGREPSEK